MNEYTCGEGVSPRKPGSTDGHMLETNSVEFHFRLLAFKLKCISLSIKLIRRSLSDRRDVPTSGQQSRKNQKSSEKSEKST